MLVMDKHARLFRQSCTGKKKKLLQTWHVETGKTFSFKTFFLLIYFFVTTKYKQVFTKHLKLLNTITYFFNKNITTFS